MAGIYHEQPLLDGWGNSGQFYDHRFMGYDQAPYGSFYIPAQPMGPYLETLEPPPPGMEDIVDDDLSSEDFEDADGLEVYGHVDLKQTLGQQLAVWSHRSPDTLAIFTPIPGDTLSTVVSFARSSLNYDPSTDHLLVLLPDDKKPVDPAALYNVKPGSSILVVPKYDYVISLEVAQLDLKFEIVENVTTTVRSLKARLQQEHGFPVERTDLLYRDLPLENQRRLFDYRINHGGTIFVMLHLVYDVHIKVETFWGLNYQLYVDPCMTTAGLLNIILRRTTTHQVGEVSRYFHLTLPRHALVMYCGDGKPMKWSSCLGLYGLDDGAVFRLSTIALAHEMNIQKIPVLLEDGTLHNFLISKFDYWSVLAMKIHGMKGYPVNLMRLKLGKREIDLATAVGKFSQRSPALTLDVSLLRTDKDVLHGVLLSFRLGNGVMEALQCAPSRTVKSVKATLEEMGVPNARVYELFVDGYRLPNHSRIMDSVEEYRKPIDLKLKHYPVFVHGPKSVIYKMNVHAQESLKIFKARMEIKTGLSQSDYFLLMAGLPVTDADETPTFKTPLAIGSSVFLMGVQKQQTVFIVWDDWLVKLHLPYHPQPSELKEILWKDRNVPEGSLASVGNFLQWYFSVKGSDKGMPFQAAKNDNEDKLGGQQRRARPRKRRDRGGEEDLWKYNALQMKQLQNMMDKQHHQKRPPRRVAYTQLPHLCDSRDVQHYSENRPNRKSKHGKNDEQPTGNRTDPPGLYYATYKDGRWQRLNPEDLVDNYLRAWSLPPDVGNKPPDRLPNLLGKTCRRKPHSADPGLLRKAQGQGRREPQWVQSLQRLAREDRVLPAYAGLKKKSKKKRKVRVK